MKIVIALLLLIAITVVLHLYSPWWLTPIASNWGAIDTTINISFWVTGFVFIAVNLFMAYAIYRYRYKPDRKAHFEPENKKLEGWLTIVTGVGVAALLVPGLFVWADFINPPDESEKFEVVGKQWHWMYRFPGESGELGRTHPRYISEKNPFGIDPDDPAGQDDILVFSNIVHLPRDQAQHVHLRSVDVLHNWSVPQFRAKMDLVPGQITNMWIEPNRTGEFEVVCLQLCGMAHHAMRGRVVVEEEADFEAWLDEQPTFAETRDNDYWGDPQAGEEYYQDCAACHGQEGEGMKNMNAPRLAGLDKRYLQRQLRYYRDGVRGEHEEDEHGQQMAAMMGSLPDEDAIRDVVAYIDTLPDEPVESTIDEGNRERGEALYRNCVHCHAEDGKGNFATGAPMIAGQHDWYLEQQMKNFREGIRGSHDRDSFGMQMMMMSQVIQDDEMLRDLLTYINSLDD